MPECLTSDSRKQDHAQLLSPISHTFLSTTTLPSIIYALITSVRTIKSREERANSIGQVVKQIVKQRYCLEIHKPAKPPDSEDR